MPKVLQLPFLEETKDREEWLELVSKQTNITVEELESLWDFALDVVDSMGDIFYDAEAFHDDYGGPAWYGKSPNSRVFAQARKQVFAGLVQVKFNLS